MTATIDNERIQTVEERIRDVAAADMDDFIALLRIAGLEPTRDLRFMDWSGVDFSGSDLRGFDFTGANLWGCRFERARIAGARFDSAQVERAALRQAQDWPRYAESWTRAASPPSGRHLPELAVFSDAPFAPEMVMLPAGEFLMGSPQGEEERSDDESPQHRVTIGTRFALARYAVTFDEYDRFCDSTDREKPGDKGWGRGRRPVISVSWLDAVAYCDWLAQETGQPYRLPSEAGWEYACRAGTTTPFSFGETITPEQVNYNGNYPYTGGKKGLYRGQTVPVGSLPANSWGLYEMHGNVWEWCADGRRAYTADAVTDPMGPTEAGGYRVLRGGCWRDHARYVRSAYRLALDPGYRYDLSGGFRCARVQGS